MNAKQCCSLALILLAGSFGALEVQAAERIPILIDTDMGADIDDAFALNLALGSEEIDLRGITTVGDDTEQKAMLVCRFLTVTGRRHKRVAMGASPQPVREITKLHPYYYHPDGLYNRTTKPEKESAVEFLHQRLKEQPGKISIVCLGPLTNIACLLESHKDTKELVKQIILLESNLAFDANDARKVFESGIPLVVIPAEVSKPLALDDQSVDQVFSPGTALSRQVEALYQMWDQHNPPLGEALAVALSFDDRWCKFEQKTVVVKDDGKLIEESSGAKVRVVSSVENEKFVAWYIERMSSLVAPASKPSRVFHDDRMPHRVHVAEDYDTDIERRWWMSGKPELKVLPPESKRACRGVLTHDFDDLLMVSRQMYTAVIFNPVPGPPMGKNPRLSFRYWLKGTDTIRIQIYSLTNGYHRQLVVKDLPQETWLQVSVDMTDARRPDGTGGPLSEEERIDDIQFYLDPNAEVVIDDVVLYDAATEDEQRAFPKRIMFTGVFDTGKQGAEWPGEFEIVPDAGNFWKAAKSVENASTSAPWIRVQLRGQRKLNERTEVSFRYRLQGAEKLEVKLFNSETKSSKVVDVSDLKRGEWSQSVIGFETGELPTIDEIHFLLPKKAELLVDDLLLYEPN